jgi:hypothetical protein
VKHADKLQFYKFKFYNHQFLFYKSPLCCLLHSKVYLQQKNYWRHYKLASGVELLNHIKKKFRDVSATLQHSVTGSPAQPTTENTKNNLQREARHLLSSQCCVVVGEKEPEVWMVHLAVAKPVICRLHEGGCKLLLLRPIRQPNRAAQFVGCQSKDWQC